MPWESIGEYAIGENENPDWVEFSQDVILQYLLLAVGEPPEDCELGFFEQDHELGVYTIVGVHWDDTRGEPPYQYISRAEKMLERFNELEWSSLYPFGEGEENEDEGEANEGGWIFFADEPPDFTVRIFWPPCKVGNGIFRIVELTDSSTRVEAWGPNGWELSELTFQDFFRFKEASPEIMDEFGIPESERTISGEVPDITLRRGPEE